MDSAGADEASRRGPPASCDAACRATSRAAWSSPTVRGKDATSSEGEGAVRCSAEGAISGTVLEAEGAIQGTFTEGE